MARTVVSSKFQVVIPQEIREDMGLRKGEVLQVIGKDGIIALIRECPITDLRGYLRGMSGEGLREKEDRV
jgi:AbrB family looped-hinge helix DNA binding protein